MIQLVESTLQSIAKNEAMDDSEMEEAQRLYKEEFHQILSYGIEKITLQIGKGKLENIVEIGAKEGEPLSSKINGNTSDWESTGLAALYLIKDKFKIEKLTEGMRYTRAGMMKRVLEERKDKAKKADYEVRLGKNLYGEHTLINENGKLFKITLRDFQLKTGYINNIDWRSNRLGTTKHIMYLFDYLEQNPGAAKKLEKTFPFIEIYTDPLNDYRVSWFFPEVLGSEEEELLKSCFGTKKYIDDSEFGSFYSFIHRSRDMGRIKIREEVFEKVEAYFEHRELEQSRKNISLDFSVIKAELYPYQKEGASFSVFRKGAIIADEMGLGKTLQAISAGVLKKEIFNFKKTLVICPASVKSQWKNEIEKFSDESATVIAGAPEDRKATYQNDSSFFHIINYETVLRDLAIINAVGYDFVILDEAQKIKNYTTKTANAVKAIRKKHGLVITGTPLENKLLDLYSIIQFIDPYFLAPQWEFSYQHCIFDAHSKNRIAGYYDLQKLRARLEGILIRREKKEVFDQLPNVVQKNIYVKLTSVQEDMHSSFSRGVASILSKKFKTIYDWQKLMNLLTNMRMVCDSSFLIDKESHFSPKLEELRYILIDRLDIKNKERKIIIFSEWVVMLDLIGAMLTKEGVSHTKLTGKVPVNKRGARIKEFEQNPDCSVFLSSEAGGSGLNLQVADTVINFELPWNPAKKNQRIGRMDRIGQKKQTLHVFNLLSLNSIEMKIATGLLLKQDLFEGVLNSTSSTDVVDFSNKGRSQFIKQLEEVMDSESTSVTEPEVEKAVLYGQDTEELQELFTETLSVTDDDNSEGHKKGQSSEIRTNNQTSDQKKKPDFAEIENVMSKGMDFLTGLYKMSTGNDMTTSGSPKVRVNKETGEVSISFKMDV